VNGERTYMLAHWDLHVEQNWATGARGHKSGTLTSGYTVDLVLMVYVGTLCVDGESKSALCACGDEGSTVFKPLACIDATME